ncbi:MAG: biosynthetic-type acetolactate synthase large subunit [Bacteroidota bacterium]
METETKMTTKPESKEKKAITGSEAVIRSLINEGVDTIFGYPGGAIMPIYDEVFKFDDQISHVLTRHEQGAAHAAQGYSRVSGKVGVCFATSGPGATNLITGISDAQVDSTPLVCITGQVPSTLLGTAGFQEIDIIGISMPVTKWNFQVTRAEEIPEAIARAFYIAKSGRPGPVLIDITKDAQFGTFDYLYQKCKGIRSYKPVPETDFMKVSEAASLINSAKKPLILAGHGILLSRAEKELQELAEKAQIPVACTLLGLSSMLADHELYMGMLGMHGNYAPNKLTNEADLLIAIGMRFDDRVTGDLKQYAKQAKVVHIEIDPSEIDKNVKADVAVLGDAKKVLKELNKEIEEAKHEDWIAEFRELQKVEKDKIIEGDIHPEEGQIKMGEAINIVSEKTNGEAIVVTDVGQHQMMTARYYRFNRPDSLITSGGLGTMGFGLPASFGAKLACPDRDVVLFVGDGGTQMTIQEMATMVQYNTPVKIVLLNNTFLGMVRQWQQLFFEKRYASTEMVNPDFTKVAEGFGLEAVKVDERKDLEEAIERMLAHEGPYLLEVTVEKEENIFPMIPSGAAVSDMLLE